MTIELPISKSVAQRLMLMQAIAGDPVEIPGYDGLCDDICVMQSGLQPGQKRVDVGQNGTAYRFLTAYYWGSSTELTGSDRLLARPIEPLREALCQLDSGAKELTIDASQSSQFVSALMLVAPRYGRDLTYHFEGRVRSYPYLELTAHLMRLWGISLDLTLTSVQIKKGSYKPTKIPMESDWSAALVWHEWMAITGCKVEMNGLNPTSFQPDRNAIPFFDQLQAEPNVWEADLRDMPDSVPYLVVTACKKGVPFRITGVRNLRYKESDRIQALATELQKKGFLLLLEEDSIAWVGGRSEVTEGKLSSHQDHRLAMSFLAAGWQVDDEACIAKSYPAFIADWERVNYLQRLVPLRHGDVIEATDALVVDDEGRGKKWALKQGMEQLTSKYVWCGDADARHGSACGEAIEEQLKQSSLDLLLLPVAIDDSDGRWWSGMQRVEMLSLVGVSIRMAQKGKPIMCNGAGLVVDRAKWLQSWSALHPEMLSGDDMFLLHSFKHRGLKIQYSTDPRTLITVPPCRDLRSFLRQRARWAGKSGSYTDADTRWVGGIVAVVCVLQLFCPLLAFLRWLPDYFFLRSFRSLVPCNHLLFRTLLWDLIYPIYAIISLWLGIKRKNKW